MEFICVSMVIFFLIFYGMKWEVFELYDFEVLFQFFLFLNNYRL